MQTKRLEVLDRWLPLVGEGNNKATQFCVAINKLIGMWLNNGDVFDNQYNPFYGYGNDISSYANWLAKNIPGMEDRLVKVKDCITEEDYENLLEEIAEDFVDAEDIENMEKEEKVGSVYECEGPFRLVEDEDEEEW